jgi:predicted phosphate transport protein (TIGR00153 family)
MRLRLTPRDTTFYDHFNAAADNLVEGARLLGPIFDGTGDRAALAEELGRAEHAGDEITHTIMNRLNTTFVTPFDREDIYNLAGSLDDVMDFMEAAADLVVLYEVGELPRECAGLVEVLQKSAAVTAEAMPRLRTMKDLEAYWIEVNRLENDADKLYRRLVAKLFSGEFDTLTVMKLKEVVDQLEAAADAFEKVAHAVQTIAVKES